MVRENVERLRKAGWHFLEGHRATDVAPTDKCSGYKYLVAVGVEVVGDRGGDLEAAHRERLASHVEGHLRGLACGHAGAGRIGANITAA